MKKLLRSHIESFQKDRDRRREQARKQLTLICSDLGCSGLSSACPGDIDCSILKQII
jgi:hypothetical protein